MNVPDLFRSWVDTTTRSMATAARVSTDIVRTVVTMPPPITPVGIEAWRSATARYVRELLEIPEALVQGTPLSPAAARALDVVDTLGRQHAGEAAPGPEAVRDRFQRLLERSTSVDDDAGEPGFLDVVGAMSPDEARIVRHLAHQGPAATLDLFAVSLLGGSSELVLPHVCLVAQQAGCIAPERVDVYLENLARLGVVRFTTSPVVDDTEYQLLEGTPDYKREAGRLREASGVRPRGRRGSVVLTGFGREFVDICLGTATTRHVTGAG